MGTTADKLNKVLQTKEAIRTAINNKGGTLTETDTFASYATAIDNIQSGGGEEKSIYVDFLDGDGTLLKREYLDEGGTATPPDDPNLDSDYLIFSGWSDTELTNITESKTIYATYTTKDNATYIFIHIPTADIAITLKFGGTITSVDWGDGTTDATLSHTYSAIGHYVIKVIGGTKINSWIFGSSENKYILKCYVSNTITTIDYDAFKFSNSLTNIILPSGITSIGNGAFYECYTLTNIILPSGITSIGNSTFYNCYSLTNIILPSGITTIDHDAFKGCNTLTSINIPSGITSIGYNAFNRCYSLTSITLPNSITSIGHDAFNSCFSLESITLPNSITSIGGNFCENCYSLTSITLPNSITSIGSYAFRYCYSLTSINIPSGITNIGSNTFLQCVLLTSINLPSTITSIGAYAFVNCYNAQQIIINADSVITIQSNSFSTVAYNNKFYVPDNLVEDYKVATNWVNFADRIYPLSSLGV